MAFIVFPKDDEPVRLPFWMIVLAFAAAKADGHLPHTSWSFLAGLVWGPAVAAFLVRLIRIWIGAFRQ